MLCLYHLPSITALSHFRSPHAWLSTSFLFSSIASRFSNVFQPIFQHFPTFSNLLAIHGIPLHNVPPSGNAWLCPRWMRSYKNGFRSTTGEWDTFSDLWQRMASFTERSRSLAMLHTFPALSGNVAPRFRSLAMLHNVSSSLWQCYITFLTSGSRGFAP